MTVLKPVAYAVGVFAWGVWAVVVISAFQAEEDLRKTGTRTVAVVVDVREDNSGDLYADIRYTDNGGNTHLRELDVTSMDETPDEFDEIDVAYDPGDPSRVVALDMDPVDRWIGRWIAIPLGVLAPGAIVWLLRYLLKRTRPYGQVAG